MSEPPVLINQLLGILAVDERRQILADDTGAWSRAALRSDSGRLARALWRQGLRRGQRLWIGLPPSREFAACALAALRLGAPFVPVNPQLVDRELAHLLYDSGPRMAIAHPPLAERIRERAPAIRVFAPEQLQMLALEGVDSEVPLRMEYSGSPAQPGDPALVLYTSGTSGKPKGVVHTQGSIAANLGDLARAWQWQANDRLLLSLPLHHLHGLVVGLLGGLSVGMQVRLAPRFEEEQVLQRLQRESATLFYGVPTMYARMLAAPGHPDLSSVRLFASGSAALPRSVAQRFRQRFGRPVLQRYGTTETGIALAQRPGPDPAPGEVGGPLEGTQIRIADPDDPARPVAAGEAGELWVKGAALFSGYLEDEEATAACHREGYYRTGDLVRRGPDGAIAVLGRLSLDVLKVRGHKVGALEIEAALCEFAEVVECAVLGIPDPDAGEVPVAFVRLAADTPAGWERDFPARLAQVLPPHQIPRWVRRVEEFPRAGPGKVDKRALRAEWDD